MENLLKFAIEAHGGLERWHKFGEVKANVSIAGALWHLKGQPNVLKEVQVIAQLRRQHLVTHLTGKDLRTMFTPGRVSIESESGAVEATRLDPVASFRGQSLESPWDMLHVTYFASYALWSYLTIPFLYTYPGFVCEEIAPWEEDDEQWRALRVTFPDSLPVTPETRFRILALTDCCAGTNIPWMFSEMPRGLIAPTTTDLQMESWWRISDESSPTTVKRGR